MKKGLFTEDELSYLCSLDAVEHADPLRIAYSNKFKKEFMCRYKAGEKPKDIFESVGLYASLIGHKRIERACAHWREAQARDALGLVDNNIPKRDDIRAIERKRASVRCAAIRASKERKIAEMEEKLARQKQRAKNREQKIIASQAAEIAALKAQVKALKALGTLARKTQRAPQTTEKSERFDVIFRLKMTNPSFNISAACKALEVSTSGYYDWVHAAPGRQKREDEDRKAANQIQEALNYRSFKKGSRQVKDCLKRTQNVIMNRKKILRLERKYYLAPKRKRRNPYHPIRSDEQSKVVANVVNRDFRRGSPLKVISTDITYLPSKDGFSYLSGLIDCQTNVILAYKLSESMQEKFVLDTYDQLDPNLVQKDTWACSDQGSHYTARVYREKLAELGINQSMSRKACCWDNAPIESFWGRLKEQIGSTKEMTHEEISLLVDNYIDYYNNERGQSRLGWLTPKEYESRLTA